MRRALTNGRHQIPEFDRIKLDRRRRTQQYTARLGGDLMQKAHQIVQTGICLSISRLPPGPSLVCFIKDDDGE